MKLGYLDLSILLAYLLGMVLFGLWIGRRQKSSADFMLGGRNFPWWVILFSIVATETSTVTFLSVPGLAYSSNLAFLQLPLGYILGRLIVVSLLLPRFFKGEMFTVYEVLHERFGGKVKQVASLLFIITRTLGDGFRLYLSAIVLQMITGFPMHYAVIGLGIATILYTFIGGMRAVLWTDFIQFIVYMAGAAIAFWVLLGAIDGGWETVTQLAAAEDKLRIFDFSFDLTTSYLFWTGLIGGSIFAIGTHGVDQMMVQRYLCARNQKDASLAVALSGPVVFLQFAFFLIIGTALYAYYTQNPPAVPFEKNDEAFASFIVDMLPMGILGIVLGAVFSAAMSTLSSSLNSAATALTNDIYLPLDREGVTDADRLRAVKTFTIFFGIAQIIVGIGGQWLPGSVIDSVLAVQGFTTGIILGVFFLAMFAKNVGSSATLFGLCSGLGVMTLIKFGPIALVWTVSQGVESSMMEVSPQLAFLEQWIPQINSAAASILAWPWFVLVGSASTFSLGKLGSLFFPQTHKA